MTKLETRGKQCAPFIAGMETICNMSLNPIPLNIIKQPKAPGGCQIGTCLHFNM